MHSLDFSSVIVLRRAGAITVQELKSLISFAIVVRESLCPAKKPKTQNFNLVMKMSTEHDDGYFFASVRLEIRE